MTDRLPTAVAQTYFDALGRGDIPTVMAQFADDVLWHQPGDNQFSGDHHGVGGVEGHVFSRVARVWQSPDGDWSRHLEVPAGDSA